MPALTAVQIKVTVLDDSRSNNVYTSFTLPNTPFYIKPQWNNSDLQSKYSQYQILWDLGDGTFHVGTSALHYYKFPGIYNVQATFYDINGEPLTINTTTDSNSAEMFYASLTAVNAVPDIISFLPFTPSSNAGVYALPAGKRSEPLKIYRYNSWQNNNFLAENNYTINLYASGSKSDYLTVEDYYTDKYAHFRQYFGFVDTTVSSEGIVISNLVNKTYTSSVSVFAEKVQKDASWGIELRFHSTPRPGTSFAGTTGTTFENHFISYIDQTPDDKKSTDLIFVYAHPDTSRFYDSNTLSQHYYPSIQFPVYGYINYPWKTQYLKSIFNPADKIAITSNGITVEGTEQTIGSLSGQFLHSFNIYPVKWADTHISFCCTFKDNNNYTTKCYPPITGFKTDGTDPTEVNTVSVGVYEIDSLDPFTPISPISSSLISNCTFKRNPSVPIFNRFGSYFAGLVSIPRETSVAVICAAALIVDQEPLNLGVNYGFAAQPGIGTVNRFTKRPIFSNCEEEEISFVFRGETATYTTPETFNLPITYAPLGLYNRGQNRVIIADSDTDKIYFYSISGTELATVELANAPIYQEFKAPIFKSLKGDMNSASPSNCATDSLGNVWITLYGALTCIKIDYNTFTVTACAVPTIENNAYVSSPYYFTLKRILSGYVGENSLLPTCVDTDIQDNIFVGYSHPVSGFIFKYSSSGAYLSAIPIQPLHSIQELIVDRTNSLWGVAKQLNTGHEKNPFNVSDLIYRWDNNLTLQPGFPVYVKNIGKATIDLGQNLWVNSGYAEITKISPLGIISKVNIGSQYNNLLYHQPIGGVGCDTDGFIWVIHNYNGKMYFYPINDNKLEQLPLSALYTADLPGIQLEIEDGSRAFYDVYGDWTGIRWINKYVITESPLPRIIRGSSNLFKVLKKSPILNKINENFDQAHTYKSYVLQESLFDRKVLLDDFVGQIVGNAESDPETLGKTIYEKIANFVSNISDPEVCTLDSLKALFSKYGLSYTDFVSEYPPSLRRAVDILSINHKKLFGTPSQTLYSFGISGVDFNSGKNLGQEIDIQTGTFIVGDPIVTYEMFSEKYELVYNTVVTDSLGRGVVVGQPYPLSGVNYNWGWGLVTGINSQSGIEIKDYYKFYRYKSANPAQIVDGVIDFNNPLTTLTPQESSYSSWTGFGGSMDTIILRTMYNGLEL